MRKLILSFALSNWLLLREWRSFDPSRVAENSSHPHFFPGLASLLLLVFALTPITYWIVRGLGKKLPLWVRSVSLACFLALNVPCILELRSRSNIAIDFPFLSALFWTSNLGAIPAAVIGAFGATLLVVISTIMLGRFSVARKGAELFLLGGLLLSIFQALVGASIAFHRKFQNSETASNENKARVVIFYFDELDQDFEKKYPELSGKVPNFDHLRNESVEMTHALSPGETTLVSIPSSLKGGLSDAAAPGMERNEPDSLFSDVAAMGKRSSIVGWHVPYCRMYGADVDRCISLSPEWFGFRPSILSNIALSVERTFVAPVDASPLNFNDIMSEAKARVVDPNYDLVLVHWNIPHLPGFQTQDGNVVGRLSDFMGQMAYVSNLKLMDRVLGQFRDLMENTQTWDSTAFIVLSDHGVHRFRRWLPEHGSVTHQNVPFLLKLPNQKLPQKYPQKYNEEVSTTELRGLVGALLRQELTDFGDVISYFRTPRLHGSVLSY